MKIAFHSYKGGVGRTKIMVAAGAILAMEGHRVGMLDFDLDASALATIFQADMDKTPDRELLHILERADPSLAHNAMIDVTGFVAGRFGSNPKGVGCLKYIPTISDPKISDQISFDRRTVYFVGSLMESLLKECGIDMLLVDLRPGYSPSSATILPLVDCAVIVTRLDRQNIEGLRRIVPRMNQKGLKSILVANLVPDNNETKKRMKEIQEATGQPVEVQIRYDPEAVFDDDIVSVTRVDSPMEMGTRSLVKLLPIQRGR